MLVIINGVETVEKRFFANKIRLVMNPPTTVGEYVVDYRTNPWTIVDGDGVQVYGQDDEGNVVNDLVGTDVLHTVDQKHFSRYLLDLASTHYRNVFEDVYCDLGILPTMEALDDKFTTPHQDGNISYKQLIAAYKASELDYYTITGVFSPTFVTKARRSLGASNVTVVNIIRNPSVCAALQYKPDSEYLAAPHTYAYDKIKLMKSVINAALIKNLSNTITVRFEDILANGGFELNGTWIPIPQNHVNYNGTITQWEATEAHISQQHVVDATNAEYANLDLLVLLLYGNDQDPEAPGGTSSWQICPLRFVVDDYNLVHGTSLTVEQVDATRKNLFAELGYEPLNYDAIVKPNDSQSQAV